VQRTQGISVTGEDHQLAHAVGAGQAPLLDMLQQQMGLAWYLGQLLHGLQQRIDRGLLPGQVALAAVLQHQPLKLRLVQFLQCLSVVLVQTELLRLVRERLFDLDQTSLQRAAQGMEGGGEAQPQEAEVKADRRTLAPVLHVRGNPIGQLGAIELQLLVDLKTSQLV